MDTTSRAGIPPALKQLRACLLCRLIKTYDQFCRDGCDNCQSVVSMRDDPDRVLDLTTTRFSGVVAVMRPAVSGSAGGGGSWVARWQRLDGVKAGMYAGRVEGRVPEEVEEELAAKGVAVPTFD